MEQCMIAKYETGIYPMGLSKAVGGIRLCVAAKGEECKALIFKEGEESPVQTLSFSAESRKGDVWSMTILGENFENLEYCFEIDGKLFSDPYGRRFSGRKVWGDMEHPSGILRTSIVFNDFNWEGDKLPQIPYEDSVIYRLHNRGFTMHVSSKVKNKGTFDAIREKIPYLKELGITAVELLPVNEFSEVIMENYGHGSPFGKEQPVGKLNYWGYTSGCYFAPKASYAAGDDPVSELKNLVKALHKEKLELIVELFFTGKEPPSLVLDAVRYWADEFHVDGIHLTGTLSPDLIKRDPYLSRIKLFAVSWDSDGEERMKHLGEYNDGFLVDMRRVLKGDEEQLENLAFRTRRNPSGYGVINYMANTNGFPMMDMVSYDTRHNEENGEKNLDGTPYNYSWNCGVEGPTRRKKVVELRKKQLRNAFLLLFLSQGTPLIMAGDEFGNSQSGNNNAYCQDNAVSWLNWNLVRTNQDILEFVKAVIAFRKAHPVFHMPKEPRLMDCLACGLPDVSYHGVKAWCPEFDIYRRQLGILYCGKYGRKPDGKADNNIYVIYNMHWEPHEFDLPNLPKKEHWHVVFHTDKKEINGMYPEGKEPVAEGKRYLAAPRTIVVFVGK